MRILIVLIIEVFSLLLEDKDNWSREDRNFLQIVISAQVLFPEKDSKIFTDLPISKELNLVLEEFDKITESLGLGENFHKIAKSRNSFIKRTVFAVLELGKVGKLDIKKHVLNKNFAEKRKKMERFLADNFLRAGSDLQRYTPENYFTKTEDLLVYQKVQHPEIRAILAKINEIWKDLSKTCAEVKDSSLLKFSYPFFVPGGRFREFYYWDSYWILQGLLICDMKEAEAAMNVIKNFVKMIQTHGFIPNGSRAYYLGRTQPPLFCFMLEKLYENSEDFHNFILEEGLEAAMAEYKFFNKNRKISFKKNDKTYKMFTYKVEGNLPRPESLKEDFENWFNSTKLKKADFYKKLKTSAESGIDFTSRTFKDPKDIKTIDNLNRVPVDLNAIVYKNILIMADLYKKKKDHLTAQELEKDAKELRRTINEVMWDENTFQWRDFIIDQEELVDRTYFSNFYPMIFGIQPLNHNLTEVFASNEYFFTQYEGGVVAGEKIDGVTQQWDYPNIWPPYNQFIIEFLLKNQLQGEALKLSQNFFKSVLKGYKKDGVFFEKYDCNSTGATGNGGEYEPQSGFGWTNGTILYLVRNFGDALMTSSSSL